MLIKPDQLPTRSDDSTVDLDSFTCRLYSTQNQVLLTDNPGLPGSPCSDQRERWWTDQVLMPLARFFFLLPVRGNYSEVVEKLDRLNCPHRLQLGETFGLVYPLQQIVQRAIERESSWYMRQFGAVAQDEADCWQKFHLLVDFPGDPTKPSDLKTLFWLDRRLNPEPFKREPGWREFREPVATQEEMIDKLAQELDGKGGATAGSMSFQTNDIVEVTSRDIGSGVAVGDRFLVTQFSITSSYSGQQYRECRSLTLERLTSRGITMGVELKVEDTAAWPVWLRPTNLEQPVRFAPDMMQIPDFPVPKDNSESTEAQYDRETELRLRLAKEVGQLMGQVGDMDSVELQRWLDLFEQPSSLTVARKLGRELRAARSTPEARPAKARTPVKIRIVDPGYVVDPEQEDIPEIEITGAPR
jgi:hypothetical protein